MTGGRPLILAAWLGIFIYGYLNAMLGIVLPVIDELDPIGRRLGRRLLEVEIELAWDLRRGRAKDEQEANDGEDVLHGRYLPRKRADDRVQLNDI